MKILLASLTIVLLAGCGIADHYTAQSRMNDAEKDYRACINQHLRDTATCEPLRKVWMADKDAYESGKD